MVTFQVDMSNEDVLGPIYVTGNSVDGWCGTCVEMTDADGDGIYEATGRAGRWRPRIQVQQRRMGWLRRTSTLTEDAACTLDHHRRRKHLCQPLPLHCCW